MSKTEKIRKGPSESAKNFSVGFMKKGNDGNMWKIGVTAAGVHRWIKIQSDLTSSKMQAPKHNKTVKSSKKIISYNYEQYDTKVSLDDLKKIAKKCNVLSAGKSKGELALLIFNIRSTGLSTEELKKIIDLLPSKEKREAKQMLMKQIENPITDYKGMWKPAPKPLHQMSRKEMINTIRLFRDAWEEETGRNQDLNDERLAQETDKNLREHLKWFYSETAKNMAGNWIRENM